MAAPMKPSGLVWLALALALALPHGTAAMYCGDKNCYEIIGVKPTATEQEIKKQYRQQSLKYHPDKNPEPEAKHVFQELARANEILTDERLRRAYDYYLEHPDDKLTNEWRYYEAQIQSRVAQADVRVVVIGAIFIISLIQYASRQSLYNRAMEGVRKTPRYKNLLKRLQEEAEADTAARAGREKSQARQRKPARGTKKAGSSAKLSAEEMKLLEQQADAEVIMHGGFGKPVWHELFAIQIFVFPVKAVKYFAWQAAWVVNYNIRGRPYSREDQAYLTQQALSVGRSYWDNLPPASQDEMLALKLWTPGATEDEKLMRKVGEAHRKAAYRADRGKGGAASEAATPVGLLETAQAWAHAVWAHVQPLLSPPAKAADTETAAETETAAPPLEGGAACEIHLVADGDAGKKL